MHETHFQNRCSEQPQISITREEIKSLPSQVNVQTVLILHTLSGSCDILHLTTLILFYTLKKCKKPILDPTVSSDLFRNNSDFFVTAAGASLVLLCSIAVISAFVSSAWFCVLLTDH